MQTKFLQKPQRRKLDLYARVHCLGYSVQKNDHKIGKIHVHLSTEVRSWCDYCFKIKLNRSDTLLDLIN